MHIGDQELTFTNLTLILTLTLTAFQIGDRVIAFTDFNAWAELASVPAQFVYKMPTGMTFQDGAAFFMNYVAAYMLLFELGNIKSGQSLLVHSAGGGVVRAQFEHYICQQILEIISLFTLWKGKLGFLFEILIALKTYISIEIIICKANFERLIQCKCN